MLPGPLSGLAVVTGVCSTCGGAIGVCATIASGCGGVGSLLDGSNGALTNLKASGVGALVASVLSSSSDQSWTSRRRLWVTSSSSPS
jgi:hypothetical protein